MLDEITGLWPAEGSSLGGIRGRQVIDPRAWYFKVHFFQDPVQPGALGVEGLMQLLEAWVLLSGHAQGREHAHFQAPAIGQPFTWKYRGSILPESHEVVTLIDIVRVTEEDASLLVVGNGTLWVDGLKIYQITGLSTRIV